ncbi:TetR/AcrR family transcriptional regulator [Phaeacidiphilus oryzae]|jgi:AcrR family transcriptional regulator|uniref:TetR/AcrR family transcriptional regulator n=1 Tax=Phaeacidiphilus oryzae TaxID=348818 RepID=UPI000566B16D|nr:TetR/AcrR family transcriptional regulator [Phaeacidiphilus oryzae]
MRPTGHQALLDAARTEFAERGFTGTSVRDIARRAGMSLSAMYHYYSGKDELLAALVEESSDAFFAACRSALAEAGEEPGERLSAMVAATVRYRAERRVESQLLIAEWRHLSEERREAARKRQHDGTALFQEIIEDGVAQGVFRTPYPDDARRSVIAMCNAIAQWYRVEGELSVDELASRYVELALVLVEWRPVRR